MLQYTLARDSLLVGFGSARESDVSPLEFKPQPKAGPRPSLFFAPTRDAHGLLTRKTFSHLLLVRRTHMDGSAPAVLLPLPTNEWVADDLLEDLIPAGLGISVATCTVRDSRLVAGADVAQSVFEFSSEQLPQTVKLKIESFVFENRLREQWLIENVSQDFAAFVVHWHQPEIHCSPLLQTTYASLSSGALASYHAGLFFSFMVGQSTKPVLPAFASCVQMQSGDCSVRAFAGAFETTLNTLKKMGSGAPDALRTQVLSCWTRYQSEPIATGTSQGLMVWPIDAHHPVDLCFSFSNALESVITPVSTTHATARANVCRLDETWLASVHKNRTPPELPEYVGKLYDRSLLTLRQMQDPGGGIIAAPEFQFEFTACGGYGYCWGRDAGFISLAMDTAGMFQESEDFYSYMAKCQAENGSFLHRHDMAGNLGPSWGLLQPDETGSVLFGLWQHVKLSGKIEGAARLRPMVERAADWLCASRFEDTDWLCEGFDLWEEREGVHLYSVAAAVAGLRAAADLSDKMNWSTPSAWRERANELSQLIEKHLVTSKHPTTPSFARTLFLKNAIPQPALEYAHGAAGRSAQARETSSDAAALKNAGLSSRRWTSDYVVDVSLLGIVEPFESVSPAYAAQVLPDLCRAIRRTLWRSEIGGIGRYEGDHYRDGQPWILTTLWLALAAARCGETSMAVECCSWVLRHTPREGQLPEQVDPVSGEPAWVMPLTWSHAMFVLACCELPAEVWAAVMKSESSFTNYNQNK